MPPLSPVTVTIWVLSSVIRSVTNESALLSVTSVITGASGAVLSTITGKDAETRPVLIWAVIFFAPSPAAEMVSAEIVIDAVPASISLSNSV